MKRTDKRTGRAPVSLPDWSCYCDNTTSANALVFELGHGLRVWFSYKTPVAFVSGGVRVIRENDWGPTTGKHLNAIDGGSAEVRKARVPGDVFKFQLRKALAGEPFYRAEPNAYCYHCNAGPYLASEEQDCPACGEAFDGSDIDSSIVPKIDHRGRQVRCIVKGCDNPNLVGDTVYCGTCLLRHQDAGRLARGGE